ncbi:MAG: hypothetical protein PHT69_05495 [Bacteroidales bacterium]|nr:hypothetical protein [Bacteroidales bacterium]
MKNFILILVLFLTINSISAQTDSLQPEQSAPSFWSSASDALQWRGYFMAETRFNVYEKNKSFNWQEYRLSLTPEIKVGNKSRFYAEIWARSLRFPHVDNYLSLSDKTMVSPLDIDLREAYFDVYDFIIPGLDLKVGRQRNAWGTADKLNPTDNLNPYDLEDIWDFGRHLASNGISLSYYVSDFTLSTVLIPVFNPSLAPDASLISLIMPEVDFPETTIFNNNLMYLKYRQIKDSLILPERTLENSVYGFRIEKPFGVFNTSVSYMTGKDFLPAPFKTQIVPAVIQTDTITIDVHSDLTFSKLQVIGADFAGSVFNLGVWAEAGLFIPEKVTNKTQMQLMGITLMEQDSIVIDDKPYIKYVGGLDYTFSNGSYLNFQYMHGFFHERRLDLHNYMILAFDIPLFNSKLKIAPCNSFIQFKDFNSIKDDYAFVVMSELNYLGTDNLRISLGSRIIEGKGKSNFGKLKNHDTVYLKFNYSF